MLLKFLFKEVRKNNCQLALAARTAPKYNIFNVCCHSISYRRIQNTIQEQTFIVWSTETKPLTHKLREYRDRGGPTWPSKPRSWSSVMSAPIQQAPHLFARKLWIHSARHCQPFSVFFSLRISPVPGFHGLGDIFHYVLAMVPVSSWLWGGGIQYNTRFLHNVQLSEEGQTGWWVRTVLDLSLQNCESKETWFDFLSIPHQVARQSTCGSAPCLDSPIHWFS